MIHNIDDYPRDMDAATIRANLKALFDEALSKTRVLLESPPTADRTSLHRSLLGNLEEGYLMLLFLERREQEKTAYTLHNLAERSRRRNPRGLIMPSMLQVEQDGVKNWVNLRHALRFYELVPVPGTEHNRSYVVNILWTDGTRQVFSGPDAHALARALESVSLRVDDFRSGEDSLPADPQPLG